MNKKLDTIFKKESLGSTALYIDSIETNDFNTISYGCLLNLVEDIQQSIDDICSTFELVDVSVAVCLPQSIENLILCLALLSKYTCIPFNPALNSEEIHNLFSVASPRLLIVEANSVERFEPIAKEFGIGVVIMESLDQACKKISLSIGSDYDSGKFEKQDDAFYKSSLILTTSGTTGMPKLVGLTWQQLYLSACAINQTLQLSSNDTVLHALPMFHIGAFVDLLLVPLTSGGRIYVKKVSETNDIINAITKDDKQLNITWYQCVPAMLHDLLRYADDRLVGKLKFIRVVSAPVASEIIRLFYETYRISIIPMYGMTEAAGQITSWELATLLQRPHSVGRSSQKMRILIINDDNEIRPLNQHGHICISGQQVIDAYLSGAEQSESHIEINGDLWLKTGDIGYLDEDNYLFITGRAKEIVNRGGEKVSLQMVDLKTSTHHLIKECAAFPIPHDRLGEEVALAIVPVVDASLINHSSFILDVRAFLSDRLASYQLPKLIQVVDDLPKTSSGKIKRHELTRRFLESHQTNYQLPSVSSTSEQSNTLSTQEDKLNQSVDIDNTPYDLITEICLLWQSILNVDTVSPQDNFFLLGGDSLLAATFIERLIERYPDISIEWLISLYDFPTASEFAQKLSTSLGQVDNQNEISPSVIKSKPSLVTAEVKIGSATLTRLRSFLSAWSGDYVDTNGLVYLKNKSGNKPPFFWCVQSYDEFNNVAQALPQDIPIYGMRTLFKIQKPDKRDNEGLANYYASIILALDIPGPYYLGGFCEGGKVMCLVAKYLQQAGGKVALLALQDTAMTVDESVAKRVAVFWTNNASTNIRLSNYITKLSYDFSGADIDCNLSLRGSFFFPDHRWLSANNTQDVSIYHYECNHYEINMEYVATFTTDLVYEIEQAKTGKPSKNQLEKTSRYSIISPDNLSYNLTAKIPRMIAKKQESCLIEVCIENGLEQTINPTDESGLTLSAQWLTHNGIFRQLAGLVIVEKPILPGQKVVFDLEIVLPEKTSLRYYQLNIGLVQEGLYWLGNKGLKDITRRVILY